MTTKVYICVGPGGVGKTTLAAALGARFAKQGKKVLVLTIDPSRRLARTLGIGEATETTKVPGADYAGELWAGVVDHKATFDDFVRRAAGKAPGAERILRNRLYQQLKSTLAGSQDFTALEKLYASVRDGGFDVVILDTPPAQHVLDFLEAPKKIAMLFNDGIARWFRDPSSDKAGFFQKMLNVGTRQILKVLENLTGGEFIRELADFFRQIESWQGKLEERTTAVHRLLTSEETSFCLVSGADRARLLEARDFVAELRRGGYRLDEVFINRAVPSWFGATEPPPSELRDLHASMKRLVETQLEHAREFADQLKGGVRVTMLPEWDERIYDLKGLEMVAETLDRELTPGVRRE